MAAPRGGLDFEHFDFDSLLTPLDAFSPSQEPMSDSSSTARHGSDYDSSSVTSSGEDAYPPLESLALDHGSRDECPPSGPRATDTESVEDDEQGGGVPVDTAPAAVSHLMEWSSTINDIQGMQDDADIPGPYLHATYNPHEDMTVGGVFDPGSDLFMNAPVYSSTGELVASSIQDPLSLFDLLNATVAHAIPQAQNQIVDEYADDHNDYRKQSSIRAFLDLWGQAREQGHDVPQIGYEATQLKDWSRPPSITRDHLEGDQCDVQGIDWEALQTTRENARAARAKFYQHATSKGGMKSTWAKSLQNTESYFRFKRIDTEHQPAIWHFQLRNLIAATSASDIYYASHKRIMRTDTTSQRTDCVIDFDKTAPECSDYYNNHDYHITTITATPDVLVAGGFNGEYALVPLTASSSPPTQGVVTNNRNGITNQIQLYNSRTSNSPQAAFCSNDNRLRILDIPTNMFTHSFLYPTALNCSAIAPSGRLRAVVGDMSDVLITVADTGKVLEKISYHTDHAFACAWADDGIKVATGAQEGQVVIYDARNWDKPYQIISSTVSCPRSLHFSPVGSGKRVLLSVEADDCINVIDGRTFDKQQSLDFFGSTAGASFTPEGDRFFAANADPDVGGIMEWERVGWGERFGMGNRSWRLGRDPWLQAGCDFEDAFDWIAESEMLRGGAQGSMISKTVRRRRGLDLDDLVI